ncbi:SymE family type I addiction module toxin [Lelliottia amnigena]|uniref:SymE family type I addiction module toxin n=1 Tax=Lelliottia amnigena TaxID=61646 RepID=UPI00192BEB7B|nr:SymE family type I addiction module toxin [Lelliottia amnigena]MBL5922078.1 SymE family type I addiction module toxin [Lelliottia amnigena]
MKIDYVSIRHFDPRTCMTTYYSSGPSRRLNGNWLAEAGFSTDTPVIVSVEQGRLVIEPVRG